MDDDMSPAVLYAWEKKWQLARHSSTVSNDQHERAAGPKKRSPVEDVPMADVAG